MRAHRRGSACPAARSGAPHAPARSGAPRHRRRKAARDVVPRHPRRGRTVRRALAVAVVRAVPHAGSRIAQRVPVVVVPHVSPATRASRPRPRSRAAATHMSMPPTNAYFWSTITSFSWWLHTSFCHDEVMHGDGPPSVAQYSPARGGAYICGSVHRVPHDIHGRPEALQSPLHNS